MLRPEDVLVIYSRRGAVAELDSRRSGAAGEMAHRRAMEEQRAVQRAADRDDAESA